MHGAAREVKYRIKAALRLLLDWVSDRSPVDRFVFLIPLVARERATDWSVVTANLRRTLASIERQAVGSQAIETIVCGQDDPGGMDGPHRQFLRHDRAPPPPGGSRDKHGKIRKMFQVLQQRRFRGYVLQLDADDLVHPDLVGYTFNRDNRHGFLLEGGLMYDLAADRIGLHGRQTPEHPHREPFHMMCGSCVVLYVDFRSSLTARLYGRAAAARGNHTVYAEVLRRFGIALEPIAWPACVYTVNHGVSISEEKGKAAGRRAYIDHNPVEDPATEAMLREAFGLPAPANATEATDKVQQ